MARADMIELDGIVTNIFPGTKFEVTVQQDSSNELKVVCTLNGKLRKNFIRIVAGDSVKIRMSPYDLTKGIIFWRG